MISDGLKKIIETFRKQGTMSFLEPATEEQISAFEKENGITFPKSTGSGSPSATEETFSCLRACSSTA